jgi:hypothetical protein
MGANITEKMVNHRDSGDFILDILEARKEFADDPYSLGIRILNIVSDFEDKVKAEFEQDMLHERYKKLSESIDKRNALGDHDLKQRKED